MLLSVGLTQRSLSRASRSFPCRDFHAPVTQASRMCATQIVQQRNEGPNRKFRQEGLKEVSHQPPNNVKIHEM